MGFDGDIIVTESNGKVEIFENYKAAGNIKYVLKKDQKTKIFPTFKVEFTLRGYVDGEIYGIICIPEANYNFHELYDFDENCQAMFCDARVDVNWHPTDVDELTVYIFTYMNF